MHLLIWQALSKRVESHPHEAKRLIGIDYEQFYNCIALFEARHLQKQVEIERTKVRINAKEVDVSWDVSSESLSLSSIFEAKAHFEILGLLFDVSKTKANDAFNCWIEILRDILPASQMEEVKGMSKSIKIAQLLTEYQLIVDSTEQPIVR